MSTSSPAWSGAAWILCALSCWAQGDAVAELEAARAAEPAAGLERVEHVLEGELPPALHDQARLLRAEFLARLSRLAEAQTAWEQLLEEGHDVSRQLLQLAGAELELRLAAVQLRSATPTQLELWGRATGPLALRLYRVDAARWRSESGPRSIGARLRAPPRAALRRVQAWTLTALDDATHTLALPALDPGLYLLAATCRGVRVARAVCVADVALGAQRDALGTRLALWELRSAAPYDAVAWALLDDDARTLRTLDSVGPLARFSEPAARAVFAWVGEAPVLFDLPPTVARPHVGPTLTPEFTRYRPGQTLRVHLRDAIPHRSLRLRAPSGAEVLSALVRPDYGGESSALLELPDYAPAGIWTLEHGEARHALEVFPAPSGLRLLRLSGPLASSDPRPELTLEGRHRARGPMARTTIQVEVRWRAATWDEAAPGPLPAWRMGAEATETLLEERELQLDADGRATFRVEAPQAAGVVRVRAWPRAAPQDASEHSFAWAPVDLALRLRAPHAVAIQSRFHVQGSMAALSGRGLPNSPATLTVSGPESWALDLRTDANGAIRKALTLPAPGTYRLRLAARDAAGREHHVEHELLAVASPVDRAVSPAAGPGGLLRREGGTLEVLAWAKGAAGGALLEVHPSEEPGVRVVPIVDGVLRARVPCAPGAVVRIASLTEGAVQWLELREAIGPATLEPVLTVEAGQLLHVSLLREGAAVAGRVQVTALDAQGAASAARRLRAPYTAEAGWVHGLEEFAVPVEGLDVNLPHAPANAPSWVRVVARTAGGDRGEAWFSRGVSPNVALEASLPKHLVEGDTAEVTVRLTVPTPGPWRVSWEEEGVDLGQARILEGGRVDPRRSVGAQEVALEATGDVLLSLPLRARRGSEPFARVRFEARSEDGAHTASTQASLGILQPGVWTAETWTGFARPGADASWKLEAPARPRGGRSRLEVVASPDWATAGFSALKALAEDRRPLAALWGLRAEENLRAAFRARRMAPPDWDPNERETLGALAPRLALSWRSDDAWGTHSPDLALEFMRLEQAGFAIPSDLRRRSLDATAAVGSAQAMLARALDGTLRGVTVPDPEHTPADALPTLARALHETGPVARQRLVLAQALEARSRLSARGLCTLWEALREGGKSPPNDLLTDALFARRGASWIDPATTGIAALALAEATHGALEAPGERVRVYVEDALWHEAWTGNGLAEWTPWVRRMGGKLRPGLRLRVEAYRGPVHCAGVFTTRIPRAQPGGTPVRRWFSQRGEPISQVRYGEPFTVELEFDAPPAAGGLLEVPLPGGCRLAAPLPDARESEGSVWLSPARRRVSLPLIATVPGRYRACPARWEPAQGEQGWSSVARLEVLPTE